MFVLSELFGKCPEVKIVETFAEYHDETLSGSDIIRITDVSKGTVYSHINKLLSEGIIKKVDEVGRTKLYQLNSENAKAKIILMLERFIVSERLEKLVKKKDFTEVSETFGASEPIKSATTTSTNGILNISSNTSSPCGECLTYQSDDDWMVLYG